MICARSLLGLTIALALLGSAHAADVIYPKGSHVGLVPLDGLKAAATFSGFEDLAAGVKVLVAELPVAAFASVEANLNATAHPDGTKPESFDTAAGKSYLNHESALDGTTKVDRFALLVSGAAVSGYVVVQVPDKAAATYSEQAIRTMLASTMMRADVPVEEQLSMLPFKVSNLADFKNVRIIPPGGAVTLSDAEGDLSLSGPPFMIVSVVPIAPGPKDDRDRIARDLVSTLPGIKNVRITSAEPMRIAGLPGYEVRLDATSAKDDKNISLVQWLRFASNATLRIVGGASREDWPKAFTRFRAVRDGVDPLN
jgi:hypothetical protein